MTSLSTDTTTTTVDAPSVDRLPPRLRAIVAAVAGLAPGVSSKISIYDEAALAEMRAAGFAVTVRGGSRDCAHFFGTAEIEVARLELVVFGEAKSTREEVAS